MKPHLKKISGYWYCGIRRQHQRLGMGWTPLQAYDDWLDRELKA